MVALCPICGKLLSSRETRNSDTVFLERECPVHGVQRDLISTDAEYWDWALKYDRPGSKPFQYSSTVEKGCPNDCGICPEHLQHTCIGIIEITGQCNLRCDICFADAPSSGHVELETIIDMINHFVSYETSPEILQLSGGEPTLHPDLFEIIRYAKGLGIGDVAVSTNGLRLLEDRFAEELAATDLVIYLQFDTFKPEVSKRMRGKDLVQEKLQAVEVCNSLEMTTVLVPTLIRGVNDHEVGSIVNYAMSQPKVFAVNFQPISLTGRVQSSELESLTIPEILQRIESQTEGVHEVSDFRPIPCPHPHCTAISYVLVDDETGEVTPLTDIVDVDEYIDYAKDRTLASKTVLLNQAFKNLFSTRAVPGSRQSVESFCMACGISVPDIVGKTVKTVAIHSFMDTHSYQLERARKCCIHLIQPDGKMIPFCHYNLFHRNNGGC